MRQVLHCDGEGVALRCGYTDAVCQKVVDLLVRDHLCVYKVQRHLHEDFFLDVSVGYIYDSFEKRIENYRSLSDRSFLPCYSPKNSDPLISEIS